MEKIELNDLLENVKVYNPDAVSSVEKAYYYAKELHDGQYRESGEPYIYITP